MFFSFFPPLALRAFVVFTADPQRPFRAGRRHLAHLRARGRQADVVAEVLTKRKKEVQKKDNERKNERWKKQK